MNIVTQHLLPQQTDENGDSRPRGTGCCVTLHRRKQFAQLIGEKITTLQISVNTTAKQAAASLLIKKTKYETPLLFICANCVAGTNSV